MRPGTERVAALVEALDHPQRSYPIVHISGTNAKFSVLCMVEALLRELGMTVGTYTSPHLETVRERIGLAGAPIDEETFASTLEYLRPYVEAVEKRIGDELTYFELLTVMAFEAFFDRAVHSAVLETGLGGEYDATNVADGRVAVVTNVSLDHVRQFGRDLHKAAWEKAGIAKRDAVVVTGVEDDELFAIVRDRAAERGAAGVVRLGQEIELTARTPAVGGQVVGLKGLHGTYDEVFLSLFGAHQAANAVLALSAVEAFAGGAVDPQAVAAAFSSLRIPGRVEVVSRRPLVVCDGAHNVAASQAVREAVAESFTFERLVLVAGMVDTKLVEEVLGAWAPMVDRAFATAPATDRAAPPERVAAALQAGGMDPSAVSVEPGVPEALGAALDHAGEDDLVLVFGSFYTVGEARGYLRSRGVLADASA